MFCVFCFYSVFYFIEYFYRITLCFCMVLEQLVDYYYFFVIVKEMEVKFFRIVLILNLVYSFFNIVKVDLFC